MAIPIDRVYQKVLALANKEQRGYITPQEFNLFADHAQKDIFRQYFYDLDQVKRRPGNDYADVAELIEEKIARFEVYNQAVVLLNQYGDVNLNDDAPDLYKLTMVTIDSAASGDLRIAEKVSHKETRSSYSLSPLCRNAELMGITARYTLSQSGSSNRLKVWPWSADAEIRISYIKKPTSPNWTYFVGGDGAALYNPAAFDHRDFELHLSEENSLVTKILQLSGISIKDYQLTGLAAQEEVKKTQQEKQ